MVAFIWRHNNHLFIHGNGLGGMRAWKNEREKATLYDKLTELGAVVCNWSRQRFQAGSTFLIYISLFHDILDLLDKAWVTPVK